MEVPRLLEYLTTLPLNHCVVPEKSVLVNKSYLVVGFSNIEIKVVGSSKMPYFNP